MSSWPLVKAALVALLPDLAGWESVKVFNGPPVTGTVPADYCTVGFVVGEDFAGSFEQTRGVGDLDEEAGTVRSEIVCTTGATDLPAVEARAFALADAWQAAVDADPTLGVLPGSATSSLAVDVQPAQTTSGATQRLTVTLSYLATS